jgi:hypothetical protein
MMYGPVVLISFNIIACAFAIGGLSIRSNSEISEEYAMGAVRSSVYDDGRVAVQLTCGKNEVKMWLCLNFTATIGTIWDTELAGLMGDSHHAITVCRVDGEGRIPVDEAIHFSFYREFDNYYKDHAECSGFLPLAPGSLVWNYLLIILSYISSEIR